MAKDKVKSSEIPSLIDLNTTQADLNRQEFQHKQLQVEFEASTDYRHGVIAFADEISGHTVTVLTATLRRMVRLRPKQPIRIDFNCNGGAINHGFHLIDDLTVIGKECPVTIAVRGQAASMGAVILQAAKTRLVGPHSYVMLHRASFGVQGSADDVEDSIEEVKMFEQRIYEIVAKRSGKSVDFWKKQLAKRKDVWYTAEEAVKIGLADAIG